MFLFLSLFDCCCTCVLCCFGITNDDNNRSKLLTHFELWLKVRVEDVYRLATVYLLRSHGLSFLFLIFLPLLHVSVAIDRHMLLTLQDYPIDVFYVFESNRLVHRFQISFTLSL